MSLRDAGFPQTCCFCGRLVLGLEGQDRVLLPSELSSDWRSLADDRFGACHLLCLKDADLAEAWWFGSADYYQNRWPQFAVAADGKSRVHNESMWGKVYLFRSDGWKVALPQSVLATPIHETETELWVPVTSYIGQVDDDYDTLFRTFLQPFGGMRKLSDLLSELDITDRVLRADVLEAAMVQQGVQRIGKSKNAHGIDMYEARHAVAIDRPTWQAALNLLAR